MIPPEAVSGCDRSLLLMPVTLGCGVQTMCCWSRARVSLVKAGFKSSVRILNLNVMQLCVTCPQFQLRMKCFTRSLNYQWSEFTSSIINGQSEHCPSVRGHLGALLLSVCHLQTTGNL